ncbi:MAG: zinc ribbon domain-containing protein [Prevotella sp.]
MDKNQQQYQEQTQQHQIQRQATYGYIDDSNNYQCPNCGAMTNYSNELCPHCKHPLHPETCTYCGAPMEPEDMFCCECGNPRAGIRCPQCGTLNFRCFCSHCNAPLDDLAHAEIEKARRSPVFQRVQQLAEQMADLEERIMAAHRDMSETDMDDDESDDGFDFETIMEMSEEDKQLMERYKELLGSVPVSPATNTVPQPKPQVQQKKKIDKKARIAGTDLAVMKAEYERQLKEMQGLLDAIQPDANTTPQMQRNFVCAHQVVVMKKKLVKKPTVWVCNFCGCSHYQPSECSRPELGGVWKYQSYEVSVMDIETKK